MASKPVDAVEATNSEKEAGLNFAEDTHAPGHHYGARAREKIRHFLHPDGKRIHVASSPEEALQFRKKLLRQLGEDEFDIFISGTPEHLDAVRQAQRHHETRREELRRQHQEVYERFADIHSELDLLSGEIARVATHGVSLEAQFNKFGYSAHIKSYDDDESFPSGATTPRSRSTGGESNGLDQSRSHQTREGEDGYATPLKVFKMPAVRQYFHKGILWRASGSEEVQSFELFVDLLYVGIIAINGDAASEAASGLSLLRFIITFTLSWKIWNDMALIISWFETDDLFQRVSIVFLLATLFGYTTNITQAFEHTYPTLIGFYLASRLYMAAYLLLMSFLLPMIRPIMLWHVIIGLVGAGIWIGSIHVSWPVQLALIFIAMFIDICGQSSYILLMVVCNAIGGRAKEWHDRAFEFYPAINIEHRTERMNAFVALVFGYTVVAMLYQSTVNGIDAFFGKAILGLIQAFCFNWMYFEIDGSNLLQHAIRRHKASAMTWTMAHLPFIMAFVLGGGALARLVVASETPDVHLDDLTEAYQDRSEPELKAGVRWFYCAGFGIALACMGVISISHVHKEVDGLRLQKRYRLVGRFCVAIILVCLPLATSLDSLELVAIVTCLIVFALGTELWACSSCNEKLCQRSKPCQYIGRCEKKKMEALIQDGNKVNLDELSDDKRRTDALVVGP